MSLDPNLRVRVKLEPLPREPHWIGGPPTPPMPLWQKLVIGFIIGLSLGLYLTWAIRVAHTDRRLREADYQRRTELCEAHGGIPRYDVRGRSYLGCDFPR